MKTLLLFLALAFAPAAVHAAEPNADPAVTLESVDPIEIGDTSPQQALVPKEVQAPERGTTVALPAGMHATATDIATILRRHEIMAYGRSSMTVERRAAALASALDELDPDADIIDDDRPMRHLEACATSVVEAVGSCVGNRSGPDRYSRATPA